MKQQLINGVRPLYNELVYYRNPLIKIHQNSAVKKHYPKNTENVIVFMVPGWDVIAGGVLSIISMSEESNKLDYIHGAEVILCSVPYEPILTKYTLVEHTGCIYRLNLILKYFNKCNNMTIHIPEYACGALVKYFLNNFQKTQTIRKININIMLQNIKMMSDVDTVNGLKKYGNVTITTAHDRYSTREVSQLYGCPLHIMSTYVDPQQSKRVSFNKKEDLLIVSPDPHPMKDEILQQIQKTFPDIVIKIIQNIPYTEYKHLIEQAKWSLTFGEGLDNYFLEMIWSGGIGFAVYNEDFFTPDFIPITIATYKQLSESIHGSIVLLNEESKFNKFQQIQYDIASSHYNYDNYVKNLENFYKIQLMGDLYDKHINFSRWDRNWT